MARYSKKNRVKKGSSKNNTRNRKSKSHQTRAKNIVKKNKNKKTNRRKLIGRGVGEPFCKMKDNGNLELDFNKKPAYINELYKQILTAITENKSVKEEDKKKAEHLFWGIYLSEFLVELFLIIEDQYTQTENLDQLVGSVKKLLIDNESPAEPEHDEFVESAVKLYETNVVTSGGGRTKPVYDTDAKIIYWGTGVLDSLDIIPPATPLRQPRLHSIRTFQPSGNSPPVTLNFHLSGRSGNFKFLKRKINKGFRRRFIDPSLVQGTALYTISEETGDEQPDEIVNSDVDVTKIKDISVHILTNIVKSTTSPPTAVPPTAAPRPFYTFSFDKKVEILQDLL
tara:strand:+ start:285 stop:1301 length:1017 start_codon:yes stop_codon:yes gene_type:complete